MYKNHADTPSGWLAFELNILRRLDFKSVAIPRTHNPVLGKYLKHWNVRVMTNDLLRSDYARSTAHVQNNGEKLTAEEVEIVLQDAYVPQYQQKNSALKNWFGETDGWWFDNVRQNISKLDSSMSQAMAINIALSVGDYVFSFDEDTRELRQPFSNVFRRLWSIEDEPFNNGQNNSSQNKDTNEFIAETYPDLLFLKLPPASNQKLKKTLNWEAWREEWVRGTGNIWTDLEDAQTGKLGSRVETKQQYLNLIEDVFKTASHIPLWAIEHIETGFVQTQDIVETISRVRGVDTIYSKDFSELLGTKAVVITA